ncbi:MAG: hypothetical protein KAY24_20020 [Candidatus Eisenbacteria sp.]|nr:hypothetical protein [Candidatus Eisenbacteria bacterium]
MSDVRRVVEQLGDQYLKWWKPTSDGKNINGACPFHHETSEGAFYMSTESGVFICHACLAKGSLLTFLKEVGASPGYRRSIMDQVGDELCRRVASHDRFQFQKDPFKKHMPLKESLLGIFSFCPTALVSAGFDPKILEEYEVGFDKKHMRITFPIRNHLGVLMGISGRDVDYSGGPRYKLYKAKDLKAFSADYSSYDIEKKNFLWNSHNVYHAAFHEDLDHIFVVEGFKAALWLIQHGAWNTVALMGTYLSAMQQRLLQRLGVDIILLLDHNSSGKEGTYQAGMRLRSSHSVLVGAYPSEAEDGDQPDDLVEEELITTLRNPIAFQQWRTQYERQVRSKRARAERLRSTNIQKEAPRPRRKAEKRRPADVDLPKQKQVQAALRWLHHSSPYRGGA